MNDLEFFMAVNMDEDFDFLPSSEVVKKIAKKLQKVRKSKFKTQQAFADHIGLSYAKVARFEKTGNISFVDFIAIVKGLNRVAELQQLFKEDAGIIQW